MTAESQQGDRLALPDAWLPGGWVCAVTLGDQITHKAHTGTCVCVCMFIPVHHTGFLNRCSRQRPAEEERFTLGQVSWVKGAGKRTEIRKTLVGRTLPATSQDTANISPVLIDLSGFFFCSVHNAGYHLASPVLSV